VIWKRIKRVNECERRRKSDAGSAYRMPSTCGVIKVTNVGHATVDEETGKRNIKADIKEDWAPADRVLNEFSYV